MQNSMNPKLKRVLTSLAIVLVVALAAAPAYYFYQKYQRAQALIKDPEMALREEKADLLKTVSKIIELPSSEEPTIATVSDVEKIKDQPFFSKSKNGDKVIIYAKEKKAYLYRPSEKRLVDVAPINLGTQDVAGASTQDQNIKVRLALFNGTQINGLTKTVDIKLLKNLSLNYEVVTRKNAVKTNYTKTLVIDLSAEKSTNAKDTEQKDGANGSTDSSKDSTKSEGKFTQQAKDIANALGGQVVPLPADEVKPEDADILIIAGPNLGE
jgi:hypothetical protein